MVGDLGLSELVVSKGGVGGDLDTLFLAVRDEFVLLEERVGFDLVHGLSGEEGKHESAPKMKKTRTGTTPVALMIPSICSIVKFETPMARTCSKVRKRFESGTEPSVPWIWAGQS